MNVMLTGSSGFLGAYLSEFLRNSGRVVYTPIRRVEEERDRFSLLIEDLFELTANIMTDKRVEVFIHCAGIAHQEKVKPGRYSRINTELTLLLAERAAIAGVKRFIFFSSIGVNGSSSDTPFRAFDGVAPYNAYTESKYRAEQGLIAISKKTGMEIVIIRPPLIYGANAPGNFAKLLKLARLPIPKPLGSIDNKRSFVSVDNLSDFTNLCITHPSAANEIFLVSDGEDLSVSQFLAKISQTIGKRAWLFPFPVSILRALASLLGKQSAVDKLSVDLQVDIKKNRKVLGWEPSVSVDEALKRALS